MTLEEKKKYIEEYIRSASSRVNSQYGEVLIDEERMNYAISMFRDLQSDLKTEILPQIDNLVQQVINNHLEYQQKLKEVAQIDASGTFNPEQLDSKLRTNSQGVFVSSFMVVTLSLINCSSIDEINKWIDSVPNLYMISPIPNAAYSPEQIEAMKKQLFDLYQDSIISTDAIHVIHGGDQKEALQYVLHKKLKGLNLSLEMESSLGEFGLSHGLPALYGEIEKICIEKYGRESGIKIANKIVNYFTNDFENFNSTTYGQMCALNEEFKRNIQKCNAAGGDFQFVVNSLNYGNTVTALGNGSFIYNFDMSTMGQELAEKLGASYRLKCIINRNTAEEMISKGFTKGDREVVIRILRDSLTEALRAFDRNMQDDGKNRTFELFNELLEIQKSDRIYRCVWEETFGISLKDLVEQVIKPNEALIRELKAKNVDFIYSETLLQESPEKRKRVMETMVELQQMVPGLITVFGDQDHTFGSDYRKGMIEQLREVAEFDKRMSEMVFGQDQNGRDIKVKIECTERDLYLSQSETTDLERRGWTKEAILKYKQAKMNIHDEIFRDVPFKRECEWTVIDNLTGDYYDHGMDTKQDSYIGKYTRISAMARKDNSQRVGKDLSDFYAWRQSRSQLSFAQRSPEEIAIAEQIKQKNQAIKQQKAQQKQKEKPKVKTLTQPTPNGADANSKGYVNIVILSLVVSFACGALAMIFLFH